MSTSKPAKLYWWLDVDMGVIVNARNARPFPCNAEAVAALHNLSADMRARAWVEDAETGELIAE